VFEFLVPDSVANGAGKVLISSTGAERSQIGLFGSEEAGAAVAIAVMRMRSH